MLASASSTALGFAAALSIALGYVLLWALWHFVFSPKRRHDDDLDRARRHEHDR